MLWGRLMLLILLCLSVSSGYQVITSKWHRLLTEGIITRNLLSTFDNERSTNSFIHSKKGQQIQIIIQLDAEYLIDSIEIISDVPKALEQSIHVGFPSVPIFEYACTPNETLTLCEPYCRNGGNLRQGIVGTTILWTLERKYEEAWTRIYDVVIRGRPLERQVVVQSRVADITLLKPYRMELVQKESCSNRLWKLTDTSSVDESSEVVSTSPLNVTYYFGMFYSITEVSLCVPDTNNSLQSVVLNFDGAHPLTKEIQLGSQCKVRKVSSVVHYSCNISDLSANPFESVNTDAKGMLKLQIFGMPFYYPRIALVTPPVTDEDDFVNLRVECIALPCGVNMDSNHDALYEYQSAKSCVRYGKVVGCKNLQLLRFPASITNSDVTESTESAGTVVFSEGKVQSKVASMMTRLKVWNATNSKLVVTVPRTHHYFSQYMCQCHSDDEAEMKIQSPKSKLTPSDFDVDLVFQRSYSAISGDAEFSPTLGIFEFPIHQQAAFFQLVCVGHSLLESLKVKVTYLESEELTETSGAHLKPSIVPPSTSTLDAAKGWESSSYKLQMQDIYPDMDTKEPIKVTWTVEPKGKKERHVTDLLRTIVMKETEDGTIKAWIWHRNERLLDIRAYFQIGNVEPVKPITIYLQVSGCSPEDPPRNIATVHFEAQNCTIEGNAENIQCVRGAYGYVARFQFTKLSASDSYALFAQSAEGDNVTQLVRSDPISKDLDAEMKVTPISLTESAIGPVGEYKEYQMRVDVKIHSKVILDNSKCHRIDLTLRPSWTDDEISEQLVRGSISRFTINVPNDRHPIRLNLEMLTNSTLKTKRLLEIPNPYLYEFTIKVNSKEEEITWPALPFPMHNLLHEFKLELNSTIKVCGTSSVLQLPPIYSTSAHNTSFRLNLLDMPEIAEHSNLMVNYELKVTPMFKALNDQETISGLASYASFTRGEIGPTLLKTTGPRETKTSQVYVTHNQLAACLFDKNISVDFDLSVVGESNEKPVYIDNVTYTLVSDGNAMRDLGRLYKITNLQPGRRYRLQVSAVYPTGIRDRLSEIEEFWTEDEVNISNDEIFAAPMEQVSINCTGSVGPRGYHEKYLEWRRADGSSLPDGVRYVVIPEINKERPEYAGIRLIFDSAQAHQAGTYGCFIQPPVRSFVGQMSTPPTVHFVLSTIELDKGEEVASPDELIQVACLTSQSSELKWISPSGQAVPVITEGSEATSDAYTTMKKTPSNGSVVVLHIANAGIKFAGDYYCSSGPVRRLFRLKMKESIRFEEEKASSTKANEILQLTCKAQLGFPDQSINWYSRVKKRDLWSLMAKTSADDPSLKQTTTATVTGEAVSHLQLTNTPTSGVEFACLLRRMPAEEGKENPAPELTELPLSSATITVNIQPVLRVQKKDLPNTNETHIRCTGYPAHATDRLQWAYLPEGKTDADQIAIGQLVSTVSSTEQNKVLVDVQSTFRLGDRAPATWPGATRSLPLISTSSITQGLNLSSVMTPERLDLIIMKNIVPTLRKGSVACEYRRPRTVLTTGEGNLDYIISNPAMGDLESHQLMASRELSVEEAVQSGSISPESTQNTIDHSIAAVKGSKGSKDNRFQTSKSLLIFPLVLSILISIV